MGFSRGTLFQGSFPQTDSFPERCGNLNILYNSGSFTKTGTGREQGLWRTGANRSLTGCFPKGLWKESEKCAQPGSPANPGISAIYNQAFAVQIRQNVQQNALFHNFASSTATTATKIFKLYYISLNYNCIIRGSGKGTPPAVSDKGTYGKRQPERELKAGGKGRIER